MTDRRADPATLAVLALAIDCLEAEAAGVIDLEAVMPADWALVFQADRVGHPHAAKLASGLRDLIARVLLAPSDRPPTCCGCDRSLRECEYAAVLVSAHAEDAAPLVALAVCSGCGADQRSALEIAHKRLLGLWPGLRRLSINPSAGRA